MNATLRFHSLINDVQLRLEANDLKLYIAEPAFYANHAVFESADVIFQSPDSIVQPSEPFFQPSDPLLKPSKPTLYPLEPLVKAFHSFSELHQHHAVLIETMHDQFERADDLRADV